MIDKIFFQMPEDPEIFLAALTTIQAYLEDYGKSNQTKQVVSREIYIGCREDFRFLLAALPSGEYRINPVGHTYDLAFSFDVDAAYQFSLSTEKHISHAFGLMLGADPKPMPELSALVKGKSEDAGTVLLLNEDFRLAGLLTDIYPEFEVRTLKDLPWSASTRFNEVVKHSIVIGQRSFETYVAASLGKTVIEIYPPDTHRRWLSKWANRQYQMIYGDPGNVSPDMIVKALETTLCKSSVIVAGRERVV